MRQIAFYLLWGNCLVCWGLWLSAFATSASRAVLFALATNVFSGARFTRARTVLPPAEATGGPPVHSPARHRSPS